MLGPCRKTPQDQSLQGAKEESLKSNRTEKEIQKRLMSAKSMPQRKITKELSSYKGKLRKDSTKRAVWGLQQSKAIQTISDATAAQSQATSNSQ